MPVEVVTLLYFSILCVVVVLYFDVAVVLYFDVNAVVVVVVVIVS